MEEQTAKNDVKDGQQNDIKKQWSLLKRFKNTKGSVHSPKTDDVKSHAHKDRARQSVFYHPVETDGCLTNKDKNDLDKTVTSDVEEQPSRSSELEKNCVSLPMQNGAMDAGVDKSVLDYPVDSEESLTKDDQKDLDIVTSGGEEQPPSSMQNVVSKGNRNDIVLLQSMLKKLESTKASDEHHKTDDVKPHALQETEGCLTNEDKNDIDSTVKSNGDEEQPNSQTEGENEAVARTTGVIPNVSLSPKPQIRESGEGETLKVKNNKEPTMDQQSDRVDGVQMESKCEPLNEACGGPSTPADTNTSRDQTCQTVNFTSREIRSASDPVERKPKEEKLVSAASVLNLKEYEMTSKNLSKCAVILGWEDSGMTEHNNSLAKTQKKVGKKGMKFLAHKLISKLKEKQDSEHTSSVQESGEEAQPLSSMELEAEDPEFPPPLPQKHGKYVVLNRTFTLKDFRLNLEPIDLMGEIFTGEEWLSYLPNKTSPDEKDTINQSKAYNVLQQKNDCELHNHLLGSEQEQSGNIKNSQGLVVGEQDQSEDKKNNQDLVIPEQDQSEDKKNNQDLVIPEQDQSEDKKNSQDLVIPEQDQSEDKKNSQDLVIPDQNHLENIDNHQGLVMPKQDQSEDKKTHQDSIKDDQQDSVAKVKSDLHGEQELLDENIFAIPKALLTNNATAQKALGADCDKSNDIYDCVEMYIIRKNDCPIIKRKSSEILPLDFLTVKSYDMLDNSALKSRIRLSKKRYHRPPKKHKKVKKEASNAKFYNVPPILLSPKSPVNASLP